MNPNDKPSKVQTASSLFLMFMTLFLGLLISNAIASLWALPLTGVDFNKISQIQANPAAFEGGRLLLLQMQATVALFSFVLFPYIYLKYLDPYIPVRLVSSPFVADLAVMIPVIVIVMMPAYAPVIEWNANVQFPDFLKSFGEAAKTKEEELATLTKYLTNFETTGELIWGFIAVSLIAGIGEEFFFRGVLQNKLIRYGMNKHAAVWVAAIIFSAIHFQFFGFVPRVLLGAVFGYLFLWSGNILYSMIAHSFHNGFTLLMMYLYHQKSIETDIEKAQDFPLYAVFSALLFSAVLLLMFKRRSEKIRFKQTEFDN
jgi:membrane protease YdiL (CAAX protease family)